MADEQPWNVGRLLSWTNDYFKSQGTDSPRLDAEVLLAHILDCQRILLYTKFEEVPAAGLRDQFKALVKRRAAGEPVAYLVGKREFYSLEFEVTPDVLIPRPETELVVMTVTDLCKARPSGAEPPRMVDIGTGSGILAICIAKHVKASKINAVDISRAALEVAKRNAEKHGVTGQVRFIQSDLFESLPMTAPYDYIVSNPPYVKTNELSTIAADAAATEPLLALDGGPEGTDVIRRLIAQTPERLLPGGSLLMEISPMISESVEALIEAAPGLELKPTIKDLAGHARVAHAVREA